MVSRFKKQLEYYWFGQDHEVFITKDGQMFAHGSNRFHELASEPISVIEALTKIEIDMNEKTLAAGKLRIVPQEKEKKKQIKRINTIEGDQTPKSPSDLITAFGSRFEKAWIKHNVSFFKTNRV